SWARAGAWSASPVQRGGPIGVPHAASIDSLRRWRWSPALILSLLTKRAEALLDRRNHLLVRGGLELQPAPHLGPEGSLVHHHLIVAPAGRCPARLLLHVRCRSAREPRRNDPCVRSCCNSWRYPL